MPSVYQPNGVVETITAATATLSDYHAGGLVIVNRAAGCTITLPSATGSGYKYEIVTINDQTGDLVINAASGDTMMGIAMTDMTGVIWPTTDTTAKITLNGTTSGGLKGARVTLRDVATDLWQVEVVSEASGTEITPFGAAS